MPLYFAYGANMDAAAMALRCKGTRALGPARLPRHRFIVTADGYASVVRDPRATVHGVLWDATLADMRVLDRFEALHTGLYRKIVQPVIAQAGPRRAIVYVGRSEEVGPPRPGYLEPILAAAEAWNLPIPYRSEMSSFLKGAGLNGALGAGGEAAGKPAQAAAPWRWEG